MRNKPIKIAPPPPPVAPVDRAALADQITVARSVADRALEAVVRERVFRDQGLSVSAALNERADVLAGLLEVGATDAEIAAWLPGFNGLIGDAHAIAEDPHALQATYDATATGKATAGALGEVQPS